MRLKSHITYLQVFFPDLHFESPVKCHQRVQILIILLDSNNGANLFEVKDKLVCIQLKKFINALKAQRNLYQVREDQSMSMPRTYMR